MAHEHRSIYQPLKELDRAAGDFERELSAEFTVRHDHDGGEAPHHHMPEAMPEPTPVPTPAPAPTPVPTPAPAPTPAPKTTGLWQF